MLPACPQVRLQGSFLSPKKTTSHGHYQRHPCSPDKQTNGSVNNGKHCGQLKIAQKIIKSEDASHEKPCLCRLQLLILWQQTDILVQQKIHPQLWMLKTTQSEHRAASLTVSPFHVRRLGGLHWFTSQPSPPHSRTHLIPPRQAGLTSFPAFRPAAHGAK